jgi:hypothetical protein
MLPDAVQTGSPTRVVATFARGLITMKAENGADTVSGVFRPDFRWSAIQLRGTQTIPVMWRWRAARVGAVIVFVSLGLAVGWLLRSRWVAAALMGPIVAAFSLWAVGTWVLESLSPGVIEYLVAIGAAALGVGLATWDRRRMSQQEGAHFGQRMEAQRAGLAVLLIEVEKPS